MVTRGCLEVGDGSPPRPGERSGEVTAAVAERMMEPVLAWLRGCGDEVDYSDPEELDLAREELVKAVDSGVDGYEIAKYLEDHHSWDGDSELVRVLDGAIYARLEEHERLTERWVREHGARVAAEAGQAVVVEASPHWGRWSGQEGVVGEVRPKTATAVVRFPQFGDVESGAGSRGIVVPAECLQPVAPPAGTG